MSKQAPDIGHPVPDSTLADFERLDARIRGLIASWVKTLPENMHA